MCQIATQPHITTVKRFTTVRPKFFSYSYVGVFRYRRKGEYLYTFADIWT